MSRLHLMNEMDLEIIDANKATEALKQLVRAISTNDMHLYGSALFAEVGSSGMSDATKPWQLYEVLFAHQDLKKASLTVKLGNQGWTLYPPPELVFERNDTVPPYDKDWIDLDYAMACPKSMQTLLECLDDLACSVVEANDSLKQLLFNSDKYEDYSFHYFPSHDKLVGQEVDKEAARECAMRYLKIAFSKDEKGVEELSCIEKGYTKLIDYVTDGIMKNQLEHHTLDGMLNEPRFQLVYTELPVAAGWQLDDVSCKGAFVDIDCN